jgi:hypothetical protein
MKPYLFLTLWSIPLATTQAALTPYTSDANTVYLYHLNEAAGASSAANAGSAGFSAIGYDGNPSEPGAVPANTALPQALNTTILGAAGFSGFGGAANISAADLGLGVDANGSGGFQMGNTNATNSPDAILQSSLADDSSGSFTIDAMIRIPAITGTVAKEIVSTDGGGATATRGFQFSITATGFLSFNFIGTAGTAVTAAIPTTGDNAFAANEWFHVAVSHDASTTPPTTSLYWTRVNAVAETANQIGTGTTETTAPGISAALIIGNENRLTANEGLGGLIDEVRISKVVRGPGDFIFSSNTDSDMDGLLDSWEQQIIDANPSDLITNVAQVLPTDDFDGDTFSNLAEFNAGSNPTLAASIPSDIDADGLLDTWEVDNFANIGNQNGTGDPDGDLATNEQEETAITNPNDKTSFPDSDGDSLSDPWEIFYFLNITSQNGTGDPDGDLYTNSEEFALVPSTNPTVQFSSPDSDTDGLIDGWEALYFFVSGDDRPTVLAKQIGTGDPDSDGYNNEQEETAMSNPTNSQKPTDTDNDGLIDSWEQFYFTSLLQTATGNPDGDAGSNLQEQNAGSNPTLAASVPTDIDSDSIPDSAEAFQPYTTDSDTLHLWHLDEVDQPAADVGSSPVPLTALNVNGRMWSPSLAGFGTGLDPSLGRGTVNGGVLSALPLANGAADDVTTPYAGANGEFTFEAIIRLDFDPLVAPASVAPMQIVSGDNDGTRAAARVWQFRLVPVNTPAITAPRIEFINLSGEVGVQTLGAPLPLGADPNAAVQGGWYHVAVAYNGSEATADNLKFYWTLLDPTRSTANELFSGQMTKDLVSTPANATPDLTIGNQGRGATSDSFLGVIDEVRISSVARTPSQFVFSASVPDSDGDGLLDAWEIANFGNLSQTNQGDFDNDGTTNLTEFRLNLIPNNGSSRFAATANGPAITWPSAQGLMFGIERSTTLTGGSWINIGTVTGQPAQTTANFTDPAPPAGKAFYRVVLPAP